jgi:hypothetical protein
MKKINKYLLLKFIFFTSFLYSANSDYIFPNSNLPSYSNYGTLGLIQMPSARMHEAGTLAFSWNKSDPYLRGSILAYPFSWLEASYQYVDINNALYSNIEQFSGSQSYKDKSFDAKLLLFPEGRFLPQIAVGARDLAGTGVFSSEYFVASKKISNVDLTLGFGWGTIANNARENPLIKLSEDFRERTELENTLGGDFNTGYFFSGDMGIFGGAEVYLPNMKGLRFKIEYDSTDYEQEGFPEGRKSFNLAYAPVKQPDSKINFGILYPVTNNVHLKLNFIKGNTINFGFSIQAPLGTKNPLIKKQDPHKPVVDSAMIKKINDLEQRYVYLTALKNLNERNLFLQSADIKDSTLDVVYSQSKHASFSRAAGRTLRVLDEIAPSYIDTFKVSNLNGGMGMHSVEISRDDFSRNTDDELFKLATKQVQVSSFDYDQDNYSFNPESNYPAVFWKISPSIRSQIGGPDGFYFGDLRLALHSEVLFSKNFTLTTSASLGLYDNFDELKLESDSVLPHVRTDIVSYLKQSKSYALKRAQFNYFNNLSTDIYTKFSFGILEEMFGGYGGEILYRPFNQNFAIGAELWRVRQREYNQLLEFRDYETTTGHINIFYKEPRSNIILALKGGRFLAEDSGISFDFSRRFKSGLRVGAFFSVTDISKQEFGEGSFDKGFYFFIPVEIFFSNYAKGNAAFGLRPITRDGAATLIHSHNLWGVTEQAQRENIIRDWDDLYD